MILLGGCISPRIIFSPWKYFSALVLSRELKPHHRFQVQSPLARLQVYLVCTQCLSLTCSVDASCHHNVDCQAWKGYSHCFGLDSRKKGSMGAKSEIPQLRGCPEAFLWISQYLNGFTYNLQKCLFELLETQGRCKPELHQPPGVSPAAGPGVTSSRARSQLFSCSSFQ